MMSSRPCACITNILFLRSENSNLLAVPGLNCALAPGREILPPRFFLQKADGAKNVTRKYLVIALGTYLSLSNELGLEASCPHCMGSLHGGTCVSGFQCWLELNTAVSGDSRALVKDGSGHFSEAAGGAQEAGRGHSWDG